MQTMRSPSASRGASCSTRSVGVPAVSYHQQTACRVSRRRTCILHASNETSSSTTNTTQQAPAPLSPQSLVPGVSGITVNGYSPTSLQGWTQIKATLREHGTKMLSAQEVVFAQERGVPIIDVRPAEQYEKGHIPGAQNVPFYQPIQGWEPVKVVRRLGYALFGVLNGTEANPNFTRDASALVDPQLGAILYCSIGGSMDAVEGSKKGLQSRSIIAAWQLITTGKTNVSIMKGGYSEWVNNGRDIAVMVEDSS